MAPNLDGDAAAVLQRCSLETDIPLREPLSEREHQVLSVIHRGCGNKGDG